MENGNKRYQSSFGKIDSKKRQLPVIGKETGAVNASIIVLVKSG